MSSIGKKPQVAPYSSHVGDRRTVGERHRRQAGAVELDEAADHALGAQHLGDGQHQVGGGDAFLKLAGQLEADDLGDQHRHGLAEHRGFRLDPADAPAEHAQAVDHGRVAVGSDQRVRYAMVAPPLACSPLSVDDQMA